ncbi:MAG: GNAT family N-acetyltransferase [Pseudomonadota bacterium]|nr:GNAT family N-acetyltransferase [Pseudomonadota bacterium]
MQKANHNLKIRRAEPQDATLCTPLIYSAGAELFDYIYEYAGFSPQDFIKKEFMQGSGFMGHKLHWVAELNGVVVGVCALYSRRDLMSMNLATTAHVINMYGIKSAKPLFRALNAGSIISVPDKNVLHLANFGVSAECRSSGIGTHLLNHAATIAQQGGFKGVSLDVSVQNPRGQALYERIGFKVVRENIFKDRHSGVPNARLMFWAV